MALARLSHGGLRGLIEIIYVGLAEKLSSALNAKIRVLGFKF